MEEDRIIKRKKIFKFISRSISFTLIMIFVKISSYFIPHIKIEDVNENPIYLQK